MSAYDFASGECIAPLVGAEIGDAVTVFPMGFVKEQDGFSLVAVLSLVAGTNWFVGPDGQWRGRYIPAVFRSYPFRLAKARGKDGLVLCVDEDSGIIKDDKSAEPFFDEQGQISKLVQDILNFLAWIEKRKIMTQQAVAALAEAGLITQWPLKTGPKDREIQVTGLYRIDESKLTSLDDRQFLTLRHAGSLPVAYAQLLSMGNLHMLDKLAKQPPPPTPKIPDIEDLFEDDGTVIG